MSLLRLAIPILIEQVLRSLMGTVNTFMLSRISDNAAAAVGVANQILNIVITASTMISTGAAVLINQNLGAGHDRRAAQITMNAITVTGMIGAILSIIAVVLAEPLVRAVGLEDALVGDATAYLRIVGASCFIQFVSTMISTVFRCHGRTIIPMFVIVFNNCINVAGSLLVIGGHLPISGVAGIASVRLIAETLGLLLIIFLLSRENWGLERADLFRLERYDAFTILRLGFMSGLEGISYMSAQLVTTGFITSFSAAVLSAKVYTQSVNNYTYVAGMAIGSAAQIMAGHMIGAGDTEGAYKFMRKAWLYVLGLNLIGSVIFFLNSRSIIGLFTDSEEIKNIARTLFMIDIATCLGRSMNHSFNFGLRAAGYVFWPMIISSVSIWLIQVVFGYFITVPLGLGVIGLWIGQASDEWLRGLCACFLWMKKKWTRTDLVSERK